GAVVVSASDIFAQLVALSLPAQKFACNVLAWSHRWNTEGGVPRHLARTNFTTVAPLSIAWQFPSPLIAGPVFSIAPIRTSPVVDRGIAFVATSPPPGDVGMLYAFDVNPARDINGDGLADDGAPGFPADYSVGSPHDVLWAASLPGTPLYAAPCGALRNLRDATGAVTGLEHVVLVSTLAPPDASVTCLRLADATVAWTATAPRSNDAVWISSPVVHRGFVYFLTQEDDGAGVQYTRVHAIDLDTGGATSTWVYPDPAGGGDPDVDEPDTMIPQVADPTMPGPAPCIGATARRADGQLLDAVVYFGTRVSFASETDPTTPAVIQPLAATSGGSEFAIVPTPPVNAFITNPPNLGYSRIAVSNVGAGAATAALQDDEITDALAPGPPWTPPTPVPDGLVFDPRWLRMYLVNEAALPAGTSTSDVIGWQEGRNVIIEYPMGGTTTSEALLLRGPVLWKRRFGTGAAPEPRIASTTVAGDTALLSTVIDPATGPALLRGLAAETEAPLLGFMPALLGVDWLGAAAAGESTAYMLQSSSGAATPWTALTALKTKPDLSLRLRLTGAPAGAWIVAGSATVLYSDVSLGPGTLVDPRAYSVDLQALVVTFDPTFVSPIPRGTAGRMGDYWDVAGRPIEVSGAHDGGPPRVGAVAFGPEPHHVPDPRRYQAAPGLIKLRYPPLDDDRDGAPDDFDGDGNPDLRIYLADIVWPAAQPDATLVDPATYNLDIDGDGRLDGVIDLTAAEVGPAGARLLPAGGLLGREVEVRYTGYSEYDEGPVVCGLPGAVLPPERHYVPSVVGASLSSPAVTGDTFHVGLEANASLPGRTVWSGTWDKAGTSVRTAASWPALPHGTYGEAPAVHRSPAATAVPLTPIGPPAAVNTPDLHFLLQQNSLPIAPSLNPANPRIGPPATRSGLVVGSDLATAGAGFVSVLSPARTLVADSTRLIETASTDVDWECIGTSSRLVGESYGALRSFTRAAKAKVLDPHHNVRVFSPRRFPCATDPVTTDIDVRTGMEVTASHLLVVDTANDRVVEIDRSGNVVWPVKARLVDVDADGTPDQWMFEEIDLGLKEPTDAYRWVSVERDTNGNGALDADEDYNGNGSFDLVYHTLVADAGNARVVDFKTYVAVNLAYDPTLTPPDLPYNTLHVEHFTNHPTPDELVIYRDPPPADPDQRPRKLESLGTVEYSHAVPIFDPATGAHIGVLCAARNLHRLIVMDVTTDPADPRPRWHRPRALPLASETPVGSPTPWRWLAWVYDRNLNDQIDDPLLFDDIRDLRVQPEPHGASFVDMDGDPVGLPDPADLDGDGTPDPYPANGRDLWPEGAQDIDADGTPDRFVYLTVTCSGYRNPPSDTDGDGVPDLQPIREPGAVEFAVDIWDPLAPTFAGPLLGTVPPGVPHWRFTRADYVEAGAGPDATVGTRDDYTTLFDVGADGTPGTADDNMRYKPWQPTSCQRLEDGTHIIVNGAPQPANVTPANFPAQNTNCSEIIHVLTDYTVAALTPGRHLFGREQLIPDPNLAPWNERMSQPAYAERY
ncbi:MAG: hypothetical protein PVH68_02840, partial [Armatimonadota bacterium]